MLLLVPLQTSFRNGELVRDRLRLHESVRLEHYRSLVASLPWDTRLEFPKKQGGHQQTVRTTSQRMTKSRRSMKEYSSPAAVTKDCNAEALRTENRCHFCFPATAASNTLATGFTPC